MTRGCDRCHDDSLGESVRGVAHNTQQRLREVVWNGTLREQLDLIAAVQHSCECRFGTTGLRLRICSSHTMMGRDQRALDGLLWVRHLRSRLLSEEGINAP